MSIQASDMAGSLARAPQVQRLNASEQTAERAAAKQLARDLEKLAQAAEEEVNTSAPTSGASVHERDARQGGDDYVPHRQKRDTPDESVPDEDAPDRHSPPGEGTIIDIDA